MVKPTRNVEDDGGKEEPPDNPQRCISTTNFYHTFAHSSEGIGSNALPQLSKCSKEIMNPKSHGGKISDCLWGHACLRFALRALVGFFLCNQGL